MLSKKPKTPAYSARLSELIRLKKSERPDAAFWDQFDREFRNRQLTALVQARSWRERAGAIALIILRKSAVFTATASVLALGLFTVHKAGLFPGVMTDSKGPLVETPIAQGEEPLVETPIFVVENTVAAASDVVADASLDYLGAPSYEVHRITKQSVPVSYRIMAEPKQFKARQSPTQQQSLGAKIIRTGNQL